jgi:3-oxoadipate enol-lactonase
MPFAQLHDARIHYQLSGRENADALVFSNPLGTNLSVWDPQVSHFEQHFRLLRYDTRGLGQSSVTPGPYSIEQLARDLLSLLDQLNLDRIHFCGLSMGGSTGLWLALNSAERIKKLGLCDTAAKIGTAEVWNPRIDAVRKDGIKAISNGVVGRWLSADFRAKNPELAASVLQMLESANPQGYVANCEAIRDFDVRQSLGSIQLPTLIIAGAHDVSTTPADGRFLADRIPGARYVELNAAHLSNIELSADFTSTVSGFLLAKDSVG